MMKCSKCNRDVQKYGVRQNAQGEDIQTYWCKECNYYFREEVKTRLSQKQYEDMLKDLNISGSFEGVAEKYGISIRTVRRKVAEKIREGKSD